MPHELLWSVLDIPCDDDGDGLDVKAAVEEVSQASAAGTPEASERHRSAKAAALSLLAPKAPAPQATVAPTSKPLRTAMPKLDEQPGPKLNGARQAAIAQPLAPLFDLSSICTAAPRVAPERTRPRLFGLEHCPIFYPTIEEFAHPMEYIEQVARDSADLYGIVKIVPPFGWRPPFSLDTRSFRFHTRLQTLNSMEASARANVNFLEQLSLFHSQQGRSKIEVPVINTKHIDLWKLRREVNRLGGSKAVGDARQWPQVTKAMGFNPSTAASLEAAFMQIIAPFEEYLSQAKKGGASQRTSPSATTRMSSRMRTGASSADAQAASAKLAEVLAMEAGDGDETTMRVSPDTALGMAVEPLATNEARMVLEPGEACEICRWDHNHPNMLLCDGCDRAYHMNCLSPPLSSVPKGQWICDDCLMSTGGDYGFEEGDDHTLESYKRRADAFKAMWLQHHPPPAFVPPAHSVEEPTNKLKMASWIRAEPQPYKRRAPVRLEEDGTSAPNTPAPEEQDLSEEEPPARVPTESWEQKIHVEDHMEREFWRLVESQHETVEVEYGADLHSTKYGSAFPAVDRHAIEPYARDGWNLNNLPIMSGSLLRFIKSDVSGMTNPWLYVGMAFSTFAWHKEDHYTYSINYCHIGETKTWYGVPGADDEKLEEAMKEAAPELFEQQPDLMFQLVTLMSPGRLKKRGVRVTACDQRPGEFVLTFPKAYHAGFNQGVNLCEAVNFCLPDWLPHGLECVQHYQKFAKHPVFSHDELLVTVYAYEKSSATSKWLYPHFKDMVDRELADRDRIRHEYPQIDERTEHLDKQSEEQYQCSVCNAFIYLSQVVNTDGRVACAEHLEELGPGDKTLRLRFDEDELQMMLQRIRARSDKAPKSTSLLGTPETPEPEQRKSGRKRIASAALREALGEDAPFAASRAKRVKAGLPPGIEFREELASDDAEDSAEMQVGSASPPSWIGRNEDAIMQGSDDAGATMYVD